MVLPLGYQEMLGCIRWDKFSSSHDSAPAEAQWTNCHTEKGRPKSEFLQIHLKITKSLLMHAFIDVLDPQIQGQPGHHGQGHHVVQQV